jgi:hypothetical protein
MAALFHSMALEYASAEQQAVDASRERNGNLLLDSIRINARYPFVVEVSGESEAPYADSFNSDRFRAVKRAQVVTANPMQRTQAGRLELLMQLMQIPGAISDASQAIEIAVSGQYKPAYRSGRNIKLGVKWENEQLARGAAVPPAEAGENPQEILEHAALKRIPSIRNNPQAMQVINDHIMSHMMAALETNPLLAMTMGFAPPQALMGAPPAMSSGDGSPEAPSGNTQQPASDAGAASEESLGVPLPKPAKPPTASAN